MRDVSDQNNPQRETLAIFTLLTHLRSDWRGTLILCCGLGPIGSSVALAANAVGATCLAVEPDTALCRAAMRAGACDFFVNTVDEALRVLKNEIRQRKPLAVALELNLSASLEGLLERGVLPEVLIAALTCPNEEDRSALRHAALNLQVQGASLVDLDGTLQSLANVINARSHTDKNFVSQTFVFETAAALKAFDTSIQQFIPPSDPRRLWLASAPRLFPRDRPYRRAVMLTQDEVAALD